MKVAVIGSGISGLVSAYVLAKEGVEVVLYEKKDYLGGHARTITYDGVDLDLGLMVFNHVMYPNMMEFFESLGVDMETCDMSFSVSLDKGRGCEWGSRNSFSSLFAEKKNLFNPYFWKMLQEITKFKHDLISYLEVLESNPDIDRNETLGQFIESHHYSELFLEAYLIPMCSAILSCPSEGVISFSAFSVLSVCRNHHLLQLFGGPQWLTIKWGSHCYVKKVKEVLESKGCQIRTGCEVHKVSTTDEGCTVFTGDGFEEIYDGCIIAIQAPDAMRMLGEQATPDELRILGAFQYVYCDIFLHRDKTLMPRNLAAWSALNYLGSTDNKVCLTYWLNQLQNLGETSQPYLVTLNPDHTPNHTLLKWSTSHPVLSVAALKASLELPHIQGKRGIWYCGAYQGYGFHEDGLKAGVAVAHGMLGKGCALLGNPKHMALSLTETAARLFVTRFFRHYISTGCLVLLEEGGTMFTFEGSRKDCSLKSILKVHSPQFYWKVMTQADLGIADAYISGDFSFDDKDRGLLNLFLSNELFSLFLGETMMYSTAIFKVGVTSFQSVYYNKHSWKKTEDEDLNTAQLRKISILIDKARIDENHEVLDIGCGWGTFAIEAVKQTGCRYTGITLSEEQLRFAEKKVKNAGLQHRIKFLLCDYRQLPSYHKYDRIISCEMLEHVGHEFMDEFFSCCESVLAKNGLFILQFISMPDEFYDEYLRSSGFMKEYIFPGGCLPSLSRVTSAMATSSRLCVEHLENIGIHYYQTLRCWRKNFLERHSEILALGFNENFIRTWEYYFDYCAAGFKSHTLGDYQIVFSRPGNALTFNNPYKGFPSAY
ncbi:putative cyclopropane-fatty-acyl-phospholipid synthase [Rosa chinensis]|uniref:Putative cyclopropane-fatty-acyl-phospholipid synthase n=1 Tax=Rosa chinensis TaxID=74649 RepID=A0A2P6QRC5_ROSCH|nr:putative cyclopropane-fatty-acyl-phospholipid synthase [Rosa chinensis]